jgi:peptide/nickel transport system permease protein
MAQHNSKTWGHYLAWVLLIIYIAVALFTHFGWLAKNWDDTKGLSYQPPCWYTQPSSTPSQTSLTPPSNILSPLAISEEDPLAPVIKNIMADRLKQPERASPSVSSVSRCAPFGFDRWGRNIFEKMLQGTRTSMIVGLGGAIIAITLGTLFGALAGFYGGSFLDKLLNGLYNIFTSVPNLLLILAIAAILQKRGWVPMVLILGLTGWTGVFRLLRAEYIRHRSRDYVVAASLIGASPARIMIKHILPNTVHLIGVQAAILSIGFIKSEVILSYLGLGVGVDEVSWGTLINEAQTELLFGFPWQIIAATLAMSILTIALSRLSDDYTDPVSNVRL